MSFVVAYLSARGYLSTGLPNLILLGEGALDHGLAYVSSWLFLLPDGTNIVLTISAIQFLVASILNAVEEHLKYRETRQHSKQKVTGYVETGARERETYSELFS